MVLSGHQRPCRVPETKPLSSSDVPSLKIQEHDRGSVLVSLFTLGQPTASGWKLTTVLCSSWSFCRKFFSQWQTILLFFINKLTLG